MIDRDSFGKFDKGNIPWNKGNKIDINLDYIKNKYNEGYSCLDISKEFNVSEKTIRNRLKEIGIDLRKNTEHTSMIKDKISKTMIRKGIQPIERFSGEVWNKGLTQEDERVKNNIQGLLENRKNQVLPKKDTTIEIKLQNLLKQLNIEFFTHQYIKEIEHGYQVDIMIPIQEGITKKTIIECFGTYWHNYPVGREIDITRCQELRKASWRVLIFWENEIKLMHSNDLVNVLKR
jgi:very-short-patch-repair endonuclease/predicted DNA-binding protein YlxM (UPF0122 family)